MSLLPNWVTRVAEKAKKLLAFLRPATPESQSITSDRAAEKVLTAMEKSAASGSTASLQRVVRGAKKLIDYDNGAFFMPRLVRVLADSVATPLAEPGKAAETYKKHAQLLMDQGCRVMVNEAMAIHKSMLRTGSDPLAVKNIAENMQLVLDVSQNDRQLARAMALSTASIETMRLQGDVAGTTESISGVRTALTGKAHPMTKGLKHHFERFLTKLYPGTRQTPEFQLGEMDLSPEHEHAFAAALRPAAPLPAAPEISPPVSPVHQARLALQEQGVANELAATEGMATSRPTTQVSVPALDFVPYAESNLRPEMFTRAQVPEPVVVPDVITVAVPPSVEGMVVDFLPQTAFSEVAAKSPPAVRPAHLFGRISDPSVYKDEAQLMDGFTETAVNARAFDVQASQLNNEIRGAKAAASEVFAERPYTQAELKNLVGVFERCLDKPGFQRVACTITPARARMFVLSELAEPLPSLEVALAQIPTASVSSRGKRQAQLAVG